MNERLILTVFALVLTLVSFRRTDQRARIITVLSLVMIGSTWLRWPALVTGGVVIGTLSAFIASLLYFTQRVERSVKLSVISSGIMLAVLNFGGMLHLPNYPLFSIFTVVALGFFVWFIMEGGMEKPEFTFLAIWNLIFMMKLF